jgi:hypothetical protein
MYAISIEQVDLAAILAGKQPVEYHSWRTDHRGPLLIHAAKRKTTKDLSLPAFAFNTLVGVVELVDCRTHAHPGADPDEIEYRWVLANPRVFARPLPYTARCGLFEVADEFVAAAIKQAATAVRRKRQGKVAT